MATQCSTLMDIDCVQFVYKWTILQVAIKELHVGFLDLLQSGLFLLLALLLCNIWVYFGFSWLFCLFRSWFGLFPGVCILAFL